MRKHLRISMEARLVAVSLFFLIFTTGLASWSAQHMEPWWLIWILILIPAIAMSTFALHCVIAPSTRLIAALSDGIASFADADFSVSVAANSNDELGDLARAQNALGNILRRERQSLYQRELLLDTVIQSAPMSMLLCDHHGRIVYCNTAARQLLAKGKAINGERLSLLTEKLPSVLRQAILSENNGLYTVGDDGEKDEQLTYHVSVNRFTLNTQVHKLYQIKHLTYEINRQEVSVWKKVIQLISHELNNSLAPISSLAHSGQLISAKADKPNIQDIFFTIKDRAEHLKQFIEGYARFSRLPLPLYEPVHIKTFVTQLQNLQSVSLIGTLPPITASFDPGQLQQTLINLIKNAHESGSPADEVTLSVIANDASLVFQLSDRGPGMSESVLKNALLPFYSTKMSGTGLGLPLCREIIEAHGGHIKLQNRADGGLLVVLVLPLNRHAVKHMLAQENTEF